MRFFLNICSVRPIPTQSTTPTKKKQSDKEMHVFILLKQLFHSTQQLAAQRHQKTRSIRAHRVAARRPWSKAAALTCGAPADSKSNLLAVRARLRTSHLRGQTPYITHAHTHTLCSVHIDLRDTPGNLLCIRIDCGGTATPEENSSSAGCSAKGLVCMRVCVSFVCI